MIFVNVIGHEVSCKTTDDITEGSSGVKVSFAFDEVWDRLEKLVTFCCGRNSVCLALDSGSSSSCELPSSVLQYDKSLYIYVYGVDADGNCVIPSLCGHICKIKRGYIPEIVTDPNPNEVSLIQQLLARVRNAERISEEAVRTAEEAVPKRYLRTIDSGDWEEGETESCTGVQLGGNGVFHTWLNGVPGVYDNNDRVIVQVVPLESSMNAFYGAGILAKLIDSDDTIYLEAENCPEEDLEAAIIVTPIKEQNEDAD